MFCWRKSSVGVSKIILDYKALESFIYLLIYFIVIIPGKGESRWSYKDARRVHLIEVSVI